MSLEYSMSVKLLTEHQLKFLSLKGGCTGLSESTHVIMPHCWKSHVTAHMVYNIDSLPHLFLQVRPKHQPYSLSAPLCITCLFA